MSIEEDQKTLVLKNIEFLRQYATDFINKQFHNLEIKYHNKININVFDVSNKDEIKQFLKNEFNHLKKTKKTYQGYVLTPFKTVSISNNQFDYDINEFLENAKNTQLINRIYPILEKQLKWSTPAEFLDWKNRISFTTELAYIKHKLNELKKGNDNTDYYPFKSLEVKKCFEIYLKEIDNKPIQYISYIFQRLLSHHLIEDIKHKTFYNWLYDKNYIDLELFKTLDTNGQLLSLDKSKSKSRIAKFDLIFKDLI